MANEKQQPAAAAKAEAPAVSDAPAKFIVTHGSVQVTLNGSDHDMWGRPTKGRVERVSEGGEVTMKPADAAKHDNLVPPETWAKMQAAKVAAAEADKAVEEALEKRGQSKTMRIGR